MQKYQRSSWRSIKNLPVQPALGALGSSLAELAIFFATSNFDLKYFCNLLTYKNVQYLIWKIWFISVWSLKPKAVVWLLTGFMLGQSTLISYHTEANGCIFFAAGVPSSWKSTITYFFHKVTVRNNWVSTRPCLCSKSSIFKMPWMILKVLPQLSPL